MGVDPGGDGVRGRLVRTPRHDAGASSGRRITHIDPWAMLRFSLVFALCLWLMTVIAGLILWVLASATGTLSNVEDFLAQLLAESSFHIDVLKVFLGSVLAAVVLLGAGAVFAAITSVLFNVSAGLAGGIRVMVIDVDDDVDRSASA